jgi:outer membrane protein OmpA-like peptidoglycan-associated protein
MSKADCKCKKVECEECPEWIFTFADLVMLMMGFFVLLWVLKPNPTKDAAHPASNDDWINVAASIREAFGYLPDPHSKDPVDLHMLLKKMHTINPVKGPVPGSRAHVEDKGSNGTDPEVQTIREGKQATVGGRLLFDRGTAEITPDTRKALNEIADKIRGHYNIVLVKGHTSSDDLAEGSAPQQAMELSLRRAQIAADFLTTQGVDPAVIRVQGCSTFEPVEERAYTPDAQGANRRVEVNVTASLVGDRKGRARSDENPNVVQQSPPELSTKGKE